MRRLDGLLQGDYRSMFYGAGVDLADLREYQPGDDVRYIDWNVTARLDDPYVRQYTEDREITAWFLLDLSPSMKFGSAGDGQAKRAVVIDLVGTLARLLTRHGNRIGAFWYTDRVGPPLPARSGRLQVLYLIDRLLEQDSASRTPLTDLSPLLETADRAIKRRSLVFVVSDFVLLAGWDRALDRLTRRHEVVAVHIVDPEERELPDVGAVIVEDAETGDQLYVDTHDRRFRQRFADAARARDAATQATFARLGVDEMTISTDEDPVAAIVRFAVRRKARRR